MTTSDVATMVAGIGLPYAYYEFPDDTSREPPFVCFMFTDNNDLKADNQNYTDTRTLVIELYTRQKDFTYENTIRGILNAKELPFSQSSDFLTDEHLYITIFTTEVFITNGGQQ